MESIQSNLDNAIDFLNADKIAENQRNKFCGILTNDLIKLDSMSHPDRKVMIIGIQNVLSQLDHLFDKDRSPILLSNTTTSRTSYLPPDKPSMHALGTAFIH